MGVRSSALIVILVFGALFTMFYSSSLLASSEAERFYQVLSSKRADISVYRFQKPVNICFEMDDKSLGDIDRELAKSASNLDGGMPLSTTMKGADGNAQMNMRNGLLQPEQISEENSGITAENIRYDGQGFSLQKAAAIVPFLKLHEAKLNHTVEHLEKRVGFSDDVHHYSCNFAYNGKYYGIDITLYSLAYLNEYSGFLPIVITNESLESKENSMPQSNNLITDISGASGTTNVTTANPVVFTFFNNTVVWQNKSDSWLTLKLTPIDEEKKIPANGWEVATDMKPVTVRLPPSTSWDRNLGVRAGFYDVKYHYEIEEYPWIQGDISLRHPPMCMDIGTARSLYSQTKFPFRPPSYLPVGYEYKCMTPETATVRLLYSSVNQTSAFNPRLMGEPLTQDQIWISISDDGRYFAALRGNTSAVTASSNNNTLTDAERVRAQYDDILKVNPAINPQLITINGNLAWANEESSYGSKQSVTFPDGTQITRTSSISSRVWFYDNGTSIHLEGYLPLKELVKVAESMRSH